MNASPAIHDRDDRRRSHPHRSPRLPRTLAGLAAAALALIAARAAEVALSSPGFTPSRVDDQGRLIEDWGALAVRLSGTPLVESPSTQVQAGTLDQVVPCAEVRRSYGPVDCQLTAFRAPAWPAGIDVLTVQVAETAGKTGTVQLSLDLPPGVRIGNRTASVGGRTVVSLPSTPNVSQQTREWGWADDATALPGWARPAVDCDPAFRNIRAGLGGVPIQYRFKVPAQAAFQVVLGFCESHWAQAGQRPVVCSVEGAPPEPVDPLARWGQHQPGALAFAAKDANGDGTLEVSVLPQPGAPDQNPILNVLWIFPPGATPNLDQVVAGRLNALAVRYVDVGGEGDQSLHAGGQVQYAIDLPAHGTRELTFLVACPGGSAPMPDRTAWSPERLRRAAADVWRAWPQTAAR